MTTAPAPGASVKVTGGPHNGAKGTVVRVRTDALVTIRTRNGQITVELYHVERD